ncbi:Glutathione S-transferase, N-terminal domain [Salipiger thiooxidans]|uniref:Glutathione S-transferase, N-terminal domain n=1 Tax=Salipiger thiooxidans TaxID=282683 RepID=A0A1G7I3L1_9RHOB|nr:Glutathione S-transferase, N-terminal domain [Salipiger thiooxidans]
MARALKGLEEIIPAAVVNPAPGAQGWEFCGHPGAGEDPLHWAAYLHELYTRADRQFTGRATVPVLWDMKRDVMVNNESADILRMFDTAFEGLVPSDLRLCPEDLAAGIDALNPRISACMARILARPGVRATVNMDHITRGYYAIKALHPTRIRPIGPAHLGRCCGGDLGDLAGGALWRGRE